VLGTACAPDPSDAPGAVASSIAAAAASASSGTCTPVEGYTAPITDKGLALADGAEMTVNAADFYFQPTCVRAVSGDTLTLRVTNTGAILHNVTIADQGIDIDVAAGDTIEVPVAIGKVPLVYICKFHRTSGMVGAVLPAGG
jgi:plastocyanin